MAYPTALDDGVSLPTPLAGNHTNSPTHAGLHGAVNTAVIAVETKIGTGASTPVANRLLFGTGTGTSAWTALTSAQLAATLSDETGTGSAVFATTPTLVTPKVDTINESTPANGVTVDGMNIKDNAITTAAAVPTVALADGAVTSAKVAAGAVVQVVNAPFSAVATGTTNMPFDDTIPQITEGDEFMTCAITPKSATNNLVIQVSAMLSNSAVQRLGCALFQDATANALFATTFTADNIDAPGRVMLNHTMTAGTTSATTFRFRVGREASGTVTFNGYSGGRLYGVTPKSSITIYEYKA